MAAAGLLSAQSGEALGRAYRTTPTTATHDALEQLANARPHEQAGALAYLALGVVEANQGQSAEALKHLALANEKLPTLRDFTAYSQALAMHKQGDDAHVETTLAPVFASSGSPLLSKSVQLAVEADLKSGRAAAARELARRYGKELGELTASAMTAQSAQASGDGAAALAAWQKVYYLYPLSKQAKEAEAALAQAGSSDVPAVSSDWQFARTSTLMKNGQARQARTELEKLVPGWSGATRELGLVRIGVARYYARENADAATYLDSLQISNKEADAERLYYLHSTYRRLDKDGDADRSLADFKQRHPASSWRVKALVDAGDRFLVRNQPNRFTPYFQQCYEEFPKDKQASYCQWRVAWSVYMSRQPNADQWLRIYLERWPDGEKNAAALYFLGRLAQGKHDYGDARGYFQELEVRFPNSYFTMTGLQQLTLDSAVKSAPIGVNSVQFLQSVHWPATDRPLSFAVTGAGVQPLERARLLTSAGLDDLAEQELRAAADRDPQKAAFAYELARAATQQGAPERGIRYIKRYAPSYLNFKLADVPSDFWKYAFPLPYRDELEKSARANGLDPYSVAALIRQESEFDPKIVSHANAYGLTQVLPGTAKQMARTLGLGPFRSSMLTDPGTNLMFGTAFLKQLLGRWNNKWEETLASYNAGPGRAASWITWADYREPAEFVESIPFTETRGYVQIVLRNADLYRKLYGSGDAAR